MTNGLDRLVAPPLQQPQQRLLVCNELLQRVAFHPRNNPGDEPARLAHLDDGNERAILAERNERSAQVVWLWHGVCSIG
jgi:hypothetical protein